MGRPMIEGRSDVPAGRFGSVRAGLWALLADYSQSSPLANSTEFPAGSRR
jgi:hypothetical protein